MYPDTPYTEPFWDALESDRFLIQECGECDSAYFPPAPVCPECHSDSVEWVECSGEGKLYAFTEQHRSAEGFDGPVVLATVDLKAGPRLLVRMDEDYEELSIGAPVELRAVEYEGGADRGRLEGRPFFRGYLA
jgi:uncharacterized OB-fold protein